MSTQNQSSYLNILAQIPLIRSPFIQFPQAVTLPYDYVQLPAASKLPSIPDMPEKVKRSNDAKARKAAIEAARERLGRWEAQNKEMRVREARRIAPGFLDTGVTMLTPTKPEPTVNTKVQADGQKAETIEDDYSTQFASLKF